VTPEDLADAVAALRTFESEVTDVEAKRAEGGLPKSLRSTASAFSNTSGGVLLLGIDEGDGFASVNLNDPGKMASDLAAMLSDEFEPPIRPVINVMEFEGCRIVVAEIPALPFDQKPCYYKGAGPTTGTWTRTGASNRRLSPYEVQVLIASRGQPRDDERGVPGTSLVDLDQEAVEGFLARLRVLRPMAFGGMSDVEILRRQKILVDLEGDQVVSLAGLLALARYPQEWFPQLNLTFVHYPEDAVVPGDVRFLDNVAIDGSIPVIVRDALAAITRNLSRRAVVSGAGRSDVLEYPEPAIREAVANALVHRDLSPLAEGTQVQVELYPSRLVVRSPGGLHGPVTVEQLFEDSVSSSRNARLLRLLEDVPIPGEDRTVVENRGSGIRTMVAALRSAGMNPPVFDNDVGRFSVTFPSHTLLSEEMVAWIEGLDQSGLSDSQILGLATMRSGVELDNPSYRRLTGVDSRVATAELQDLVGREVAEQIGERRWARYRVSPRIARGRQRLVPADRRQQILQAIGGQTLSAREIEDRTGIPVKTVRHWLKRLRDEGRVEFAQGGGAPQSNNTRYVLTEPDAAAFDGEVQPKLFE
jgi:ATP-dependent DNA helicase RecG